MHGFVNGPKGFETVLRTEIARGAQLDARRALQRGLFAAVWCGADVLAYFRHRVPILLNIQCI